METNCSYPVPAPRTNQAKAFTILTSDALQTQTPTKNELNHDSHHHNMKTVPKQSQSTRTIFFEIASVGACCCHACGRHSDEAEMTG